MSGGQSDLRGRPGLRITWLPSVVVVLGFVAIAVFYVGPIGAPRFTRHPELRWQRSLRFRPGSDRHMAFSADGKRLAAGVRGDAGVSISIWNTADGRLSHNGSIADWSLSALAFSSDGAYLACALYRSGPGEKAWKTRLQILRIVDVANTIGVAADSILGENVIASLAFSPNGHAIAILAPTMLKVWEVPSCRELIALETGADGANSVAFAPDGKLLAAAMDTEVKLLHVASRKWRTTLKHPYGVGSVAFSPDGATLAAIVNDAPARLWNVATGELEGTLPTGANQAGLITITKAGNKLLTFSTKLEGGTSIEGVGSVNGEPQRTVSNRGGTTKGTLELWNLHDRLAKIVLIPPTANVQTVIFCPATGILATCSGDDDRWIELWDLGKAAD